MTKKQIEDNIAKLLLSNIKIHIGDKILKSGQLILFRAKEFHYIFTIKNAKNELKEYQLPYPFKLIKKYKSLGFSYKLNEFYRNNESVELQTKIVDRYKKNKLYDNVVYITTEQ